MTTSRKRTLQLAAVAALLIGAVGAANAQDYSSCDRSGGYDNHDYQTPTYGNSSYTPVYRGDHNQVRFERQIRRRVRQIMRRVDYNGDGFISRREARYARLGRSKFHKIDRNRDGFLSRRELRRHVAKKQRRKLGRDSYRYTSYR